MNISIVVRVMPRSVYVVYISVSMCKRNVRKSSLRVCTAQQNNCRTSYEQLNYVGVSKANASKFFRAIEQMCLQSAIHGDDD